MDANDHLSPWITAEQIAVDVDNSPTWHDLLIRAKAAVGDLPFTLVHSFGALDDAKLDDSIPAGLSVIADSRSDRGEVALLSGSDALVSLQLNAQQIHLYAGARTAERRDEIDAFYTGRFPAKVPDPELVKVNFVFCDRGISRVPRLIRARPWAAARGHYPASAARVLDDLMMVTPTPSGRVVILHGPPGTGKTTALLTLAREWRDWCRFSFVLDPDALFSGNPSYLMQLALDVSSDDWQMLVLEDTADLLRPTGQDGMHPGLARLLNLTDGALGQGLRLMVCITTNESLSSVHRALRRPGRCLASIEVGALKPTEANLLLPHRLRTDQALTLADVLERRGDLAVLSDEREAAPAGTYL